MDSKTSLLDLPNELFRYIFQYLSSIDLLKSFFDCKSRRLQALIHPFLLCLDVSQESFEWIQTHLLDLSTKYNVTTVRLQTRDLDFLVEHLSLTGIQSLDIVNDRYTNDISEDTIGQLRHKLKRLSIADPALEDSDLLNHLFHSDSQLEQLIISNCTLYLFDDDDGIGTSIRLTHLSVELEGIQAAFILINHSPNLQQLEVKIRSQECLGQPAPNTVGVRPCSTLRSVTFTGWIKYFDHVETFITTFGSTIEHFSMNIEYNYHTIDGTRLEHGLLDKMPRLSSFDLIIFSPMADDDPIDIETFRSVAWQKMNPVVYWYDRHAQQHTIFTVPYKSDRFEYLSNEFFSTWISNRPISLCLNRVRTLSLTATTLLKRQTFLLIRKMFPNTATIDLVSYLVHPLAEEEEENTYNRNVQSLDEDLLSDMSLQVPSVTKLNLSVWSQQNNYKIFHRFLHLFPNLIGLELYIEPSLLLDILEQVAKDDFAKIICARIKKLTITCYNGMNDRTDPNIQELFPNATTLITHDHDD